MGRRRTLLVVEDNDDLRELFRFALNSAGFDVHAAADGGQALRLLDGTLPDLVVLDLVLPGFSGYDVLAEITTNAHLRHIPVVIVTGMTKLPQAESVACILRKPVTAPELVATVERCLAQPRSQPQ